MAYSALAILALLSTRFSDCTAYTYVGCYADSETRAANDLFLGRSYSVAQCASACINYNYFAVQDGDWCVCENSYYDAARYGASDSCSSSGTGGGYANSLYYKGDSGGIPYGYVGCFADQADRAVSDRIPERSYSVGGCANECGNYNYFAVQDGDWCACDNSYTNSVRYGESNGCSPYGTGGGYTNSLYIQSPRFEYIGCYQDTANRAANDAYKGRGYTPYTCNEACTDYQYFVVQDGDWCACEDDLSEATQYGTSTGCNFILGTGGGYVNSLYTHQIGTVYADPLGEWRFVAGGGGGASITYAISVGLSNYHSSSMTESNTVSLSATLTQGYDFMGASGSVSLTASQSQTVSESVMNAAEKTQTETITISCPAGDAALYQYVTEVSEQPQNGDSEAFLITTQRTWCISSASLGAPKCPYEYCEGEDCQTCTVTLGADGPFVILFNVLNNTDTLYGFILGFLFVLMSMCVCRYFCICRKNTQKKGIPKVLYDKVELSGEEEEEEENLCDEI